MHYAEFAEDEVCRYPPTLCTVVAFTDTLPQKEALFSAIKEYENNKWKVIGQKVGKPAKACEQFAKEHFPRKFTLESLSGWGLGDRRC